MDPITLGLMASAAIGGGSSLLSGFMNSSSAQSINQQQLNFSQEQASGAFLPAQVANAKLAGINPLAVIGSGSGAGLNLSVPNTGAGVAGAGQAAATALRAYAENIPQVRMQKLQEQKLTSEVQGQDLANVAQRIQNAKDASGGSVPAKGQGVLTAAIGHKPAWPFDVIDDALGLGRAGLDWGRRALDPYERSIGQYDDWLNRGLGGR